MHRVVVAILLLAPIMVVCGASTLRAGDVNVAQPPPSFKTEKARKCLNPINSGRTGSGLVGIGHMVTTSDGWCSRVAWWAAPGSSHAPWDSATLVTPPEHGELFVTKTRTDSIIGYRAVPGYVGDDAFKIRWAPNGMESLVHVTVEP
jgi:hypothetical protein